MKQLNESDINVTGNIGSYSDECARAVQIEGNVKMSQGVFARLGSWLLNCVEAHHERVCALGVYRRERLDNAHPGQVIK